jgi:hypothetical protein
MAIRHLRGMQEQELLTHTLWRHPEHQQELKRRHGILAVKHQDEVEELLMAEKMIIGMPEQEHLLPIAEFGAREAKIGQHQVHGVAITIETRSALQGPTLLLLHMKLHLLQAPI